MLASSRLKVEVGRSMANEEHVALLKQGVDVWNKWREENPEVQPDLDGADLARTDLKRANLSQASLRWTNLILADLEEANLRGAYLEWADLNGASLIGASLERALLSDANLRRADLTAVTLEGAFLANANLAHANLEQARLTGAYLSATILGDANLSNASGLDKCQYFGPSIVDHLTVQRSGKLHDTFLRGCGLPNSLIDYFPSLLDEPIQFYSCFISYSSDDGEFARRLHADLQGHGVRCWFAPEDFKVGDRLHQTIDTAIRVREKLLLILSETSVASAWVTREVETALEEEDRHSKPVLFPIRLDDAVFNTTDQWAHDIKRNRHIGDFTGWKDHDEYRKGLERLLRDLKVERE